MKKFRIILWTVAVINLIALICFFHDDTVTFNYNYTLIFMGPIGLAGLILSIIQYKMDKKNGKEPFLALITVFAIPLAVACFIWFALLIDMLFSEDKNVALDLIHTVAQFA